MVVVVDVLEVEVVDVVVVEVGLFGGLPSASFTQTSLPLLLVHTNVTPEPPPAVAPAFVQRPPSTGPDFADAGVTSDDTMSRVPVTKRATLRNIRNRGREKLGSWRTFELGVLEITRTPHPSPSTTLPLGFEISAS